MVFEQIEKIKRQYTDKYVMVDGKRPELARFRELVGQVKTVNMSGRALVEFQDYHLNISWFDIDLDYLKVVDKPPAKQKAAAAKKVAATGAAGTKTTAKPPANDPAQTTSAKKLSPLEMARQADGGGKPKQATAEPLAAARGEAKSAGKPAEETPGSDGAKKGAMGEGAPANVDRSKMSVADMLAAARGESAAAAASAPKSVEASSEPDRAPEPEPAPAEPTADSVARPVDKSAMSIDQMIAYCREHDA